ncbi:MAG: AAA family ATPase [Fimbriimonadaceae bacterium]
MKTLAVTSGKGGVGKTALACSLATIIARDEKKVLLVDANFGLPNVDLYCGLEMGCTLGHVVRDGRELRDAVMTTEAGVDVLSGGSGWKELSLLDAAGVAGLVDSIVAFASGYDHVIFDCPSGFGDRVNPLLLASDGLMLVTLGDGASLMNTYAMLKTTWELKSELVAGVVVNRSPSTAQGKHIAKEVQGIVGQFLSRELHYWGSVREDAFVLKACLERRPFSEKYPVAGASQDLIDAANCVMGGNVDETVEVSFLGKLKSKFGKGEPEAEVVEAAA